MARSDERSQHGKKRAAEGDPDGAQPLTKRFGRLQLDNVKPSPGARAKYHDTPTPTPTTTPTPTSTQDPLPFCTPQGQGDDHESMILDDTTHTTYVYDLDRELADSDSPPGALVLLPLAERMLAVPDSVLSDDSSQGKELVLYSDPSSLSVPIEQDSVRRAIIESRARARAKKIQQQQNSHSNDISDISPLKLAPLYSISDSDSVNVCDDDPMDID
ncbi:hypothetical protein N7509_007849 [Penicillium cosmopolitanum]|uniref:Uncharacterized protein n=1 Tax=Penicillium cosmopolitanum TaxID=1131564 RepID=A0A9X0B8S1_9EURO|nr:uncharacterized protein N7509_007849 [Penicillium cosmopolitanum]KAJ5392359.1 hypothetical protein N7509_007849 [Penicillium cosmopolitanum]